MNVLTPKNIRWEGGDTCYFHNQILSYSHKTRAEPRYQKTCLLKFFIKHEDTEAFPHKLQLGDVFGNLVN